MAVDQSTSPLLTHRHREQARSYRFFCLPEDLRPIEILEELSSETRLRSFDL